MFVVPTDSTLHLYQISRVMLEHTTDLPLALAIQGDVSDVQEAVTVESLPTQEYIRSLTDTVATLDESLQAIERQQRHFIHVRCSNLSGLSC